MQTAGTTAPNSILAKKRAMDCADEAVCALMDSSLTSKVQSPKSKAQSRKRRSFRTGNSRRTQNAGARCGVWDAKVELFGLSRSFALPIRGGHRNAMTQPTCVSTQVVDFPRLREENSTAKYAKYTNGVGRLRRVRHGGPESGMVTETKLPGGRL